MWHFVITFMPCLAAKRDFLRLSFFASASFWHQAMEREVSVLCWHYLRLQKSLTWLFLHPIERADRGGARKLASGSFRQGRRRRMFLSRACLVCRDRPRRSLIFARIAFTFFSCAHHRPPFDHSPLLARVRACVSCFASGVGKGRWLELRPVSTMRKHFFPQLDVYFKCSSCWRHWNEVSHTTTTRVS